MNDFVTIARTYISTPFHHQGRMPGVGLDCAGVVVCALKESGYPVEDVKGYGRIPANGLFQAMMEKHCDPISFGDVQTGDLLMFAFRGDMQHIAIYDNGMLIHAYSDVFKVVENSLDATWMKRLRGCYRLRAE